MITSGGPYQTNPAMVEKMRDLASVINRIGGLSKLNSEVRWLSEAKFKEESVRYASPPVKGDSKGQKDKDIIEPEHSVSSTITGLRKPGSRQRHRMRTPGSTGNSSTTGGTRSRPGVGAHKT